MKAELRLCPAEEKHGWPLEVWVAREELAAALAADEVGTVALLRALTQALSPEGEPWSAAELAQLTEQVLARPACRGAVLSYLAGGGLVWEPDEP